MPNLHRMYNAGQATIVHAVASPYRERSHFDGQDVLESGFTKPGAADTGWLNRALGVARAGRARASAATEAFAVGPVTPLVVRGPAPVMSWTPPKLPPASDDTVMRLLDLYRHTDPALARALEERIDLAAIARAGGMDMQPAEGGRRRRKAGGAAVRAYFAEAAGAAAKFMARDDGPRVGALAFDGWDTHANEGAANGRLAHAARRARRRARRGRDRHGRGLEGDGRSPSSPNSAAPRASTAPRAPTTAPRPSRLLAGGALKGGRVIADWPGLAKRSSTKAAI